MRHFRLSNLPHHGFVTNQTLRGIIDEIQFKIRDKMCFVAPPARSRPLQNVLVRAKPRHPRYDKTEPNTESKGDESHMSKSEKRNRTALLPSVRCLPEEKEAIQEKAKVAGLSLGEFLRRSALGRRIDAQCDTEMIMELRRLGGLQKHLFKEGEGLMSKEYSQVLVALQNALLRVGRG